MIYMAIDANRKIGERLKATLTATPTWATNTFEDADADALKAFNDAAHYTYDSTSQTWTYMPPTTQEQFQQSQSAKFAWLESAVSAKVAAGFPSSADSTQRYYAIAGVDATGMTPMQKWTSVLTMIAAGLGEDSYTIKDMNGDMVTLTQAQYKQFAADGQKFMNKTIEATSWTKEAQIKACTTEAQLETIGWPNPKPPSVPQGLTGTAGTGEVTLTWTANTDVTMIDGGGYNIYQDGTKVNTALATSTTYTGTGLTSGTSYSFAISAVDTDGNESAQSTAVAVTPN
ncbi:fibronectin type III domain-containing protein [Alicyclobacillus ferrooxydans]|uniref:Fibronectin type-III domain-containing protein n=1 Tax=Alicyclobacillus ferrooxydans TaxID=471514 RepID=A0A0P9ETC3_9BACL|nr:fibronectin type III domain-containing protein [Alicyclobacillus ferrooxydans]KPV42028.1 hypothetical protein AN477_19865 [Alicyclobacillus ferrooxydans]